METLHSLALGLGIRILASTVSFGSFNVSAALVGIWEGYELQRAAPASFKAFGIILLVDYILTASFLRQSLVVLWSGIGFLLAEFGPSLWHEGGLREICTRYYPASEGWLRRVESSNSFIHPDLPSSYRKRPLPPIPDISSISRSSSSTGSGINEPSPQAAGDPPILSKPPSNSRGLRRKDPFRVDLTPTPTSSGSGDDSRHHGTRFPSRSLYGPSGTREPLNSRADDRTVKFNVRHDLMNVLEGSERSLTGTSRPGVDGGDSLAGKDVRNVAAAGLPDHRAPSASHQSSVQGGGISFRTKPGELYRVAYGMKHVDLRDGLTGDSLGDGHATWSAPRPFIPPTIQPDMSSRSPLGEKRKLTLKCAWSRLRSAFGVKEKQ